MPDEPVSGCAAAGVQRAGKYLTFVLADEEYGLEILRVREIISLCGITSIPRTPVHVKGVVNLRGKVIPVVDLRLKFGLAEAEPTDETCIVVMDLGDVETGVVVDKVSEVLDIPEDSIDDAPSFGAGVDSDFILGMGKTEGRVTLLLDICKVLDAEGIRALRDASGGND
jgi:purine-binding chemotaxis protein CheW